MAIKDVFKDVLKHTHSLGIFEMVKITGTLDKTEIETVDADKTVIFKGETHNAVPDFVDSTIGLSRMGVLQGYLQYPGFDDENAKQEVANKEQLITELRNGEALAKLQQELSDTKARAQRYRKERDISLRAAKDGIEKQSKYRKQHLQEVESDKVVDGTSCVTVE